MVYPYVWKEDKKEVVGFTIQPTSNKKNYQNLYLGGIKQCCSHIIGILNGTERVEDPDLSKDKKLRFGTIVYEIPKEFKSYSDFYSETVGKITPSILQQALKDTSICKDRVNQIHILKNVLTYQDVFRNYKLPERVKQFYNL